MITSESESICAQVLSKLPTLRHYAELDINDEQYSELVDILNQFIGYVHTNVRMYVVTYVFTVRNTAIANILYKTYCVYTYAKQQHLGCKKSARPIRSHYDYISDQKL